VTAGDLLVRPARTSDVSIIKAFVDGYANDRILLGKASVTLYEDVQEFVIAEIDGQVVGCGALHVLWQDLAEVRTLAVAPEFRGHGVGAELLNALIDRARDLGVERVFCLTFETSFFGGHGFVEIEGTPVEHDVYMELLQSYDDGVAEFLGLERVKPNTLGNHRMLRLL
jgi:amino-acid N-acetyltransferase